MIVCQDEELARGVELNDGSSLLVVVSLAELLHLRLEIIAKRAVLVEGGLGLRRVFRVVFHFLIFFERRVILQIV